MKVEKKIPFRNNLRKTSRHGKNYLMWAWHTQHSTMFICSKLILVTCSLWFESPASLKPPLLVVGGPIPWPDGIATESPQQPLEGGLGFSGTQFLLRDTGSLVLRAWLLSHLHDDSSDFRDYPPCTGETLVASKASFWEMSLFCF